MLDTYYIPQNIMSDFVAGHLKRHPDFPSIQSFEPEFIAYVIGQLQRVTEEQSVNGSLPKTDPYRFWFMLADILRQHSTEWIQVVPGPVRPHFSSLDTSGG
jgi:hypothetical protein